jgi:pimeloyl-ACP methyl ester carboxylesterase
MHGTLSSARWLALPIAAAMLIPSAGGLAQSPAAASPATPGASGAPRSFGAAWTSVGCADLGVLADFDQIADCGYVTVPEDRTATSNDIKLGVVRIRATSGTSVGAVVEGVGGPGGNGLAGATAAWVGEHKDIVADHDWVFFTQRGSQGAEPFLDCEGYSLRELNAGTKGLSPTESRAAGLAAIQACVADFTAKGVDLGAYNTVENASDIVDIKDALGYDKIVYYGESYGTQLGQFLLRDHPDALSAIILDGVVPVTKTSEIQVTDIPGSFRRVWAACAADAGCAKAYPDPEDTLAKTLKELDKKPAKVSIDLGQGSPLDLTVDGSLAMQAMFLNLYTGDFDLLPARIYQLAAGDTSALEPLLRLYFGNISRARVMHFAINCTDDPATQADLDAKVPALYEHLYRENVKDSLEACAALKVPQLPDSSDALVTSDIPALVLQGGMDPATWTDGGDSVAAGLTNAFNITFPAGGHIQSGSACGIAILTAFLADPTSKPDTSCIPAGVPMASPVQLVATNEEKTAAITVTAPAGQKVVSPEQSQGGSLIIALTALPPGDVEQTLAAHLKTMPVTVEDPTILDGPTVAGRPSKRISSAGAINGTPAGIDVVAFGDDKGVYLVATLNVSTRSLDSWRANGLPALLKTVEIAKP